MFDPPPATAATGPTQLPRVTPKAAGDSERNVASTAVAEANTKKEKRQKRYESTKRDGNRGGEFCHIAEAVSTNPAQILSLAMTGHGLPYCNVVSS